MRNALTQDSIKILISQELSIACATAQIEFLSRSESYFDFGLDLCMCSQCIPNLLEQAANWLDLFCPVPETSVEDQGWTENCLHGEFHSMLVSTMD